MMILKFKRQQFQADAVNSVVECYKGQVNDTSKFTLDKGKKTYKKDVVYGQIQYEPEDQDDYIGFKNRRIDLTKDEVLDNIKKIQARNGLLISPKLDGNFNLTIEMETGTGKTYTYIKTMFELYRQYGWSKYIIVVPSIAIREGIFKAFEITQSHFMEQYSKKIRYFIYDSRQLHKIEQFASDSGINVMIINVQAFNARGKDARRIYMELDDFQSRKPIDVIAQTNPIVIIDEPQSVEGKQAKESLVSFNPLMTLRYSATHRPGEEYNKIYRLDALDAYNKKLVKKIEVKGISVKGTTGTEGYLYLEAIDLSQKHAPVARLEYEEKNKTNIKNVTRLIKVNDSLYEKSNMEQYKGYVVSEINGAKNTISFSNGVTLAVGEAQGDVNDLVFRRIQIRETIRSHFEKEKALYAKGIKVLSLFFIDEVAKYRKYSKDGAPTNGEYADIFEEEYLNIVNEYITILDDPYSKYLKKISEKVTHNGYFSMDKQGRMIDSKTTRSETESDDVDAYDLIMKNKEKLLSFEEPVRFIFSHSALKEGWDNPNVFQICTLKHSSSNVRKRQEVGRGLRLCVNQNGDRIDSSIPGIDVHDVNVLTVIASESYESFAKDLQSEIAITLSERPLKADKAFFINKVLTNAHNDSITIDERVAARVHNTFIRNRYLDDDDKLTDEYFKAEENASVNIPEELEPFRDQLIELVSNIYSTAKTTLVEDNRSKNIKNLEPNDNYRKKEFHDLWNKINHKTAYRVDFDTKELVQKCIDEIERNLSVSDITYQVKHGEMNRIDSKEQLEKGEGFKVQETISEKLSTISNSSIKYDLIGKIVDETKLPRSVVVDTLSKIKPSQFVLYQKNPEEFILKTCKIINEQKATMIIERITYDVTTEVFDSEIFTKNNVTGRVGENAFPMNKHIYDYVCTDSKNEIKFAENLDTSNEVCVYAKLPRGFYIPTPVGNYNPDWAIVFNEGKVKHIYFIAETKGSMDSMELRKIESAKIHCAQKHFEKISSNDVKYGVVDSYEKLLEIVR